MEADLRAQKLKMQGLAGAELEKAQQDFAAAEAAAALKRADDEEKARQAAANAEAEARAAAGGLLSAAQLKAVREAAVVKEKAQKKRETDLALNAEQLKSQKLKEEKRLADEMRRSKGKVCEHACPPTCVRSLFV